MSEPTDKLIDRLAGSAQPVRPNRPLVQRFALITIPIILGIALVGSIGGDPHTVMSHMTDPAFAMSTVSAALTGLAAIFAALTLSTPGRTRTGTTWVLFFAFIWLASSAVLCTRGMAAHAADDMDIFASADCFMFIMMSGTVLALLLQAVLRHMVFINAMKVTALLGLATATLGTTLLAFFHPPETDVVDLVAHLAATAALILFMITAGRGALQAP